MRGFRNYCARIRKLLRAESCKLELVTCKISLAQGLPQWCKAKQEQPGFRLLVLREGLGNMASGLEFRVFDFGFQIWEILTYVSTWLCLSHSIHLIAG